MFSTIILFILVLAVLVFAHELGHFWVAKKMGMAVEEFGFGFPPKMFGWEKGGTIYSINWIPLGGFVRIKGENGILDALAHDSFVAKKIWQRFLVLIAGVTMNFLLAAVLLSVGFMFGMPSAIESDMPRGATVRDPRIEVVSVLAESPAARAGVESGDVILSLNQEMEFFGSDAVRTFIVSRGDSGITLKIKRDGEVLEKTVSSELLPSVGIRGIGVGLIQTATVSFPFHLAIWHGFGSAISLLAEIARVFASLLWHLLAQGRLAADLSGPVGIAVMTGEAASLGFMSLLQFTALLSLNLAVINALPFPALDGGRIIFLLFEKIRRKSISRMVENFVHNLGFALLMVLIVAVTYRDVVRFGGGFMKKIFGN